MAFGSESEDSETRNSILNQLEKIPLSPIKEKDVSKPKNDSNKRYVCDYKDCEAKFSRPGRLNAHKASHTGEKQFHCDFQNCEKKYTSQWHLRRHQLNSHICKPPNETYFKCTYPNCSKQFQLRQNLNKHVKRIHESSKPVYTCSYCSKVFHKHSHLRSHLYTHTGVPPLKCNECGQLFVTQHMLRRHQRGHKIHICPEDGCLESFKNWSLLRKHVIQHKEFICHHCSKSYNAKCRLKLHVQWHLFKELKKKKIRPRKQDSIKVQCDKCGIILSSQASKSRHMKVIHGDIIEKKVEKLQKPRAKRKDAGIPKTSLAVVLSEVMVPKEVEVALIHNDKFDEDGTILKEIVKDQIKLQKIAYTCPMLSSSEVETDMEREIPVS